MNASMLFLTFFAQSADTQTIAELFEILDTNKDGMVTTEELSDSQKPYFVRALRVADQNEDGALSRSELTRAVTEPQKLVVDTSATRNRNNFDPSRLDWNGDGKLSKSEIPDQLKERLQRAFDLFGGDNIPISELRKMMQGQRPTPSKPATDSNEKKEMMQRSMTEVGRNQIGEAVRRLDTNKDGKLSRRELEKAPRLAQALDRNRDGEVSAAEIAAVKRQSGGNRSQPEMQSRSNSSNAASFFDRLDANSDGKLTGQEIPQRMRQRLQQVDTNGDRAVSRSELAEAMKRAGSRGK